MATPPPSPPPPPETVYLGFQQLGSATDEFNLWNFIIGQLVGKLATVLPVQVMAVNIPDSLDGVGTVDVQPMVNQQNGAGDQTPHGTIYGVPYMRLQGGANAIIMDPMVGDIGAGLFCSRDISVVKSKRAVAQPGSRRSYSWADGLYIGGFLNGVPTQYIQFNADGILAVSSTKITLQAPDIELDGAVHTTGAMTGDLSADFTGEVTGNGIPLSTHLTPDIMSGADTSPGPVAP